MFRAIVEKKLFFSVLTITFAFYFILTIGKTVKTVFPLREREKLRERERFSFVVRLKVAC